MEKEGGNIIFVLRLDRRKGQEERVVLHKGAFLSIWRSSSSKECRRPKKLKMSDCLASGSEVLCDRGGKGKLERKRAGEITCLRRTKLRCLRPATGPR